VVAGSTSTTRSGAGPTDAALVVAARAGERWAQEALFQRHCRLVIALSQRLLPHSSDADDLVQDAFVYAFHRLDSLQNPQAFAAWLASIVVRTASKRLRRQRLLTRLGLQRNEPIDLDAVVSPSAPPEVVSELKAVYALLDRLPAEQRVALVLRRIEGMELAEIATAMKLSLATVKRRLVLAEARLQRERERV
jgi:RNA polymerase sigma-70 factor (ECF subfamily)